MELNEKENHKYEIIGQLVAGIITRKEASFELHLSLKQIDRLKKIYKEKGKQGFIHKNRGKLSEKKIDNKIIMELENLYLIEYYDYNLVAFYEEVKEKAKYDISYSTLYNAFLNDDIISPIAHKETTKLYNENMKKAISNNENISDEKMELFESRQIAYEQAHVRRSSNRYVFGQEIQMDACEKMWFGGIVSYLHLAIDKGTKKILFGWFEYEEITRGYFILLYNIIINYVIPARIKTDNRNSFSNNKNKVDSTQFGSVCEILRIELITTSSPTAKANIERENGVVENRLIAELRHEGITEIDKANKYLNEIFIPKMNKKFSYEIDYKTSKMKPNNYSEEELKLIISEKFPRIIDNASSIKYNNKYYVPINPVTGTTTCFKKHTECTFIIDYDGNYWSKIENNYYKLYELEDRDSIMKKEIINDKPLEKKKYIPPESHPWRKNMMLK